MVDAGETVSLTLKREFGEETMDSLALNPEDRADLMVHLDAVFKKGIQVYRCGPILQPLRFGILYFSLPASYPFGAEGSDATTWCRRHACPVMINLFPISLIKGVEQFRHQILTKNWVT